MFCIIQVVWKYFYSTVSSGDHGTIYQLRNKLNRSNVASNPTSDFNACDDFFVIVIKSHIITAALEVIEDIPNLDTMWMQTPDKRESALCLVAEQIADKFINFNFHQSNSPCEDQVFQYATEILSLGCFYLEFSDAIREGDGKRILRCWKYLLPVFKFSNRTNYSNEVLNMLVQYHFTLSPRHAHQLIWSRTINTHGLLNRLAKEVIKGLGANKSEKAICRVGNALGMISPVLDQYDKECGVSNVSGAHTSASAEKDIATLVSQLQQADVMKIKNGRKHHGFPKVH